MNFLGNLKWMSHFQNSGYFKNGLRKIFRRRFLIIAVLFIQIIFILLLIASSSVSFRFAAYTLNAVSIIVCFHILNKKEKSGYKLTWIFLILLFPIFGGIVYLIFHTQSSPKKLRKKTQEIHKEYQQYFNLPVSALSVLKSDHKEYAPSAVYLEEFAGFPVYVRTSTEFFDSGEKYFKKLLTELKKAKKYIFLEFFILRPGLMLDPIIEILEQKAQAGLDVRIIYDDLGCFTSLPSNYKSYLEKKGIKCIIFNPFKPVLSSLQNNRDHRKIISIDGKTAFTGGINLADEYINARERFGHWKDSGIMLKGEAAWSLTLIFLQAWNFYSKIKDEIPLLYPWKDQKCKIKTEGFVQPYADSPIDAENVGEHVYIKIINNAKEFIYINTPYLVIDNNLLSALCLAAKSGIDVRIVIPHHWDKWILAVTSRSYYRQLISAGVKLYEYTKGFNHSKTFVSDDNAATVGTTNLDFRSLYLHFECGVLMYKTKAVDTIKQDFINTLPLCQEMTLKDCSRNAVQSIFQDILRLFAPLM